MGLGRRLARLCDVRPGEARRTALTFGAVLLLIAAYTTTKAVRDAVFLAQFGLRELSYVMIGTALAAGGVVAAFKRATARLPRDRIVGYSHGLVALSLVLLAVGLHAGIPGLPFVLFVWSSLFSLVLLAEFWLLANDLFDAREAKRLFAVIGAGAIFGGVVGGMVSTWLARPLGAINLLFLVALELLLSAALCRRAYRHRRVEVPEPSVELTAPPLTAGARLVQREPYLRRIALLLMCMTVSATLVQWQCKTIVKVELGGDRDAMTALFGGLAASQNLTAFALQLAITPRLLKRFGLNLGLRVLPIATGVASLGLLSVLVAPLPPLIVGVAALALNDGLRFSMDKASTELLYMPVPWAVKNHAKPFIDTVVDRLAGGLSGFAWLFLSWTVDVKRPAQVPVASLLVLTIVAIWLVVAGRARRGYLDAYHRLLGLSVVPAAVGGGAIRGRVERQARRRVDRLLSGRSVRKAWTRRVGPARLLEELTPLLQRAYPAEDIPGLLRALLDGPPRAQAGALEVFDEILQGRRRGVLLELFEGIRQDRPADRSPRPGRPRRKGRSGRIELNLERGVSRGRSPGRPPLAGRRRSARGGGLRPGRPPREA